MTRRPDWRSRLFAEIDRAKFARFAWGTNDCTIFVARCVEAMTGIDYRVSLAREYADSAGARSLIRAAGFQDLPSLVASIFDEIHPSRGGVGDIAAVPSEGAGVGCGLGIFIREHIAVMGPDGYGLVPRALAVRAFRVT